MTRAEVGVMCFEGGGRATAREYEQALESDTDKGMDSHLRASRRNPSG